MMPTTSKIKALRAPDGAWEVPIIGEVGHFSGDMLLDFLMTVKPSEVKFLVRSPGGTVFDVFDAIDYMNANGIKSYTEVYGDCLSAVTLLAAHSTPERTSVTQSSRFGIHKASGAIGDQVFVAHANERITSMYGAAYGWTPAKIEKMLTDNNGTGTVWMGEEIISAGIASEMLTELKVAARMERVDTIINEPNTGTMKVKAKLVSGWDTVKALAGQEVEVEIDPTAELKTAQDALAQATTDRQAAETKAQEATDAETALQAKLTELEAKAATDAADSLVKVTTAEAATVEVTAKFTEKETEVVALTAKITALTGDVKALKALPTSSEITLSVEGTAVDPGEPNAPPSASHKFVGDVFAQMSEVEKAVHARRLNTAKK